MDKIEQHKEICSVLIGTYNSKNHDYGDSFARTFNKYGLTASLIRLEDKLSRLETLSKKKSRVDDESIEDTLLDLANYAIMTVIELRGQQIEEEGPSTTVPYSSKVTGVHGSSDTEVDVKQEEDSTSITDYTNRRVFPH